MSIRIIHTADLHFGNDFSFTGENSTIMQEKAFQAFKELLAYCSRSEHRVDILLIAGDLFHTHNPPSRIKIQVKEALAALVHKGVNLILLPGNHDSYGYKNSIYKTEEFPGTVIKQNKFDYVTQFDLRGENVFLYGGVFEPGMGKQRILSGFKVKKEEGIHIGLLHGTLESKGVNIRERDLPFSVEEFKKTNLNYLALGHFHSSHILEVDKSHTAAYSGSLYPLKIDEYGEHHALQVDFQMNGEGAIKKVKFFNIQCILEKIDLSMEKVSTQQDLIKKIKKMADKERILTLLLDGVADFSVNEEEILLQTESDFFSVRLKNNIQYMDSALIQQIMKEETVRGIYFKKLFQKYDRSKTAGQKAIIERAIHLGFQKFIK
ncbi:MAG: metallophosphoesterase [Spirochaetes bacterium]|nr:metallophosphoesterase [Spirochaetota bacterium]